MFNANKGDLAREIDGALKEFTKEATRAGFAQVTNSTVTMQESNDCNSLWNWD